LWKKRLGTIKSILSTLAVALAVLIPLYGFLTNALDEFSRGLLFGALLVAFVAVVVISVFDFWVVSIAEAESLALAYLEKKEKIAKTVSVENVELRGRNWYIVGTWVPSSLVLSVGKPTFGDINVGKKFEIMIDARRGNVVKYSSTLKKDKLDQPREHASFGGHT
jgi:hypothetical protein